MLTTVLNYISTQGEITLGSVSQRIEACDPPVASLPESE